MQQLCSMRQLQMSAPGHAAGPPPAQSAAEKLQGELASAHAREVEGLQQQLHASEDARLRAEMVRANWGVC